MIGCQKNVSHILKIPIRTAQFINYYNHMWFFAVFVVLIVDDDVDIEHLCEFGVYRRISILTLLTFTKKKHIHMPLMHIHTRVCVCLGER